MKCISLWQPYASLVVLGAKQYETRGWATKHRGTLLIHAAQKTIPKGVIIEEPFWTALGGKPWNPFRETQDYGASVADIYESMPLSCIIGAVEVVGCYQVIRVWEPNGPAIMMGVSPSPETSIDVPAGNELAFGDYAPGRFAWKLENPRRFKTPIPYRGLQKIFNVPDELVAEQMKAGGK